MEDIDDDEDNVQDFACSLDEEKEEENENEEEKSEIKQINEKINEIQTNSVEKSWNLCLDKLLEDLNENSVELVNKLNQVCKELKFYENSKRLELIKRILKDTYNYSRINFNQRLIDFCEFILSEKNLEFDIINSAVNNIDYNVIKKTNKDIIFFWKESIVENYCSFLTDKKNVTNFSKKIIKALLEENYNIAEIYNILYPFRFFLNDDKLENIEILDSIFSIITSYGVNNMDNDLIKIINENRIENKEKKKIGLKQKAALDFYLQASSNQNAEPKELTIDQLLNSLRNMNPELKDEIIRERKEQLIDIQSIVENPKYKDYAKINFQNWTRNEFPKLDFEKNKNESISKVLGMISLAIKAEKGYTLRNAQLIAILMFIGKQKQYGLVEEISTGEGKSCIICSLSIFFALLKKKVDIISSSYLLAQRDSQEFGKIYEYFNLTTDYPKNSIPEPYNCNILYGTFLEFEGDCLREFISDKKIRNNRPYEVIIIDEVDNLFIDNILSSTRLTGSTKGFKYLIPLYLSAFLMLELYDFLFLFFFAINLKHLDEQKRKKYERLIKEPEYRKKIISELTKSILASLDNNKEETLKDELKDLNFDNIDEEDIKKGNKLMHDVDIFFEKLEDYVKFPEFLETFTVFQMNNWINSAFKAKNYMNKFIDYVVTEGKNRDVAPVDRENTGETELSTVYSDGLHQMLEIKEKLRIKDETLTDTFLSHITFFQKYKNNDEFLFFGLTGTIGDKETQKIYKTDYFKSKLLFIPQYKKKRFIELPPIFSNILEHPKNICIDIIINYSRGRKILVICESIKEAQNLKKELLNFDINSLKEAYPFVKENYKNFILLYTRSDTSEKENYKNKQGKIILSTNFGGRGTDIKTTPEEEKNGGMHVILTKMPTNYRVLKQAFGRTSREGKKGTGQIILKQEANESFSDVVDDMNKNEKERIENIQKHLKIILFKDKMFIKFCSVVKNIDKNSCLFDDIRERWAMFLKTNISKYSIDDFNEREIEENFNKFKNEVEETVNMEQDYKKYNNPFLKIEAGIKKYKKFEDKINNYLDIDIINKRFFFVIPYLKAIVLVKNYKNKYDDKFYKKLINYLEETKKCINLLIRKSIDPVLQSFSQWNNLFKNFRLELEDNKIDEEMNEMEILAQEKEDFFIQYKNIKNILRKLDEKIKFNLNFIETYRIKYKDNDNYRISIIQQNLCEGLELTDEEEKEKGFFYDSSCYYVFDFEEKLKITDSFFMKVFMFLLLLIIFPLALSTLVIGGISLLAFYGVKTLIDKIKINKKGNLDMEDNSIFSSILGTIIRRFKDEENQQRTILNAENENPDDNITYKSLTKSLKFDIYEKVELSFQKIKKLKIVKFLLFVDIYQSNEFWNKKIYQIIKTNFKDIYETKFNEKIDLFKGRITKQNYEEIKITLIFIFERFWEKCLKDFVNLGHKKEYNEETGINSLEHLIRFFNPQEITEEIIENTFKQILKYKLFDEKGYANKKLFKDCLNKNDVQKFPVNITTNINKEEELIELSKLNDFVIKGFKIPNISSYFLDLKNFYKKNGYDIEGQRYKDYRLFIINNIKDIIKKIFIFNEDLFNIVFQRLLIDIKILINKLLDNKVFSKSNMRNIEKEIGTILTEQEKIEFDKLISKS